MARLRKSRYLSDLLRFGIQPEAKSGLFFSSCVYKCVKTLWKNQGQKVRSLIPKKKFKKFYNSL